MKNLENHFQDKRIIQRSITFATAVLFVIILCTLHGIKAKERTIRLIDQMIENGNLTGKFWRVIQSQNGQITITKYQRIITLACALPRDARIGDKISFIADLENANGQSAPLWHPTKIHFHGTSSFKYGISVLSMLLVFMMALKYFRFDRKSFSLTFRKRAGRCLMA